MRTDDFTHAEADRGELLRTAEEITVASGVRLACRAADLLQVADAKELAAERLMGFADDQLALARAAGLPPVKPR